ncbi:PaaI family thioesterase [Amaricoccus sp.]|uniref:PaaI family thioesterase n=1 Tax=Amaricoccus sp. TaxID=1872485 RepID=UPI001B45EB27|nr:PaaI family thioesterase [Amaricoccus sp.]MBP7240675.1 PaaI family thioesterase [Amaricoccus sp.]
MQDGPRRYGTATAAQFATLSGRATLERMLAGELPAAPMWETLGLTLVEVGDGVAVFEGDPGPHLLNPLGTVHGGWALTLVDSATGCAAHTVLAPGQGYATVETKANFSRPITPATGRVRCAGRVVNTGRRVISAEATLADATGRILAHGTSTLLVL